MKDKILDCITFFDNNFMFDLRYNILKEHVDYFVICESKFDHQGNKKQINFIHNKKYDQDKIKHIVMDQHFPKNTNAWENQAIQREFLLNSLDFANQNDYIFFSDPDEIPRPELLINFNLKKKYGIFMQRCFNYKFNLYNKYESPWEGTRVCKKKYLRSIDYMRQEIKAKNLRYNFLRIDKEKNIQLFHDSGWHFNNIMEPEEISIKLKTFAHAEFSGDTFSDPDIIKKKISQKIDLFERNHHYEEIKLNDDFPKYILKNKEKYQNFLIEV
jgi:beta-1,4-mannosyl-glycoprotein beta-1,4-N-acetylglucosaminyltransferase